MPDPVELAIDHMAYKRITAYRQRMRDRRAAGTVARPVKPKPEICQRDKWNASVRAELEKMQEQTTWLTANALIGTDGIQPTEQSRAHPE